MASETAPPMEYGQDPQFEEDYYYGSGSDLVNTALVGTHNGEDFATLPQSILNARPKERLTDEEKLARDCMRRRQTDLERRARIFDAKRRMIGVDKEALDAQVAEKNAQKEQKRQMDRMANHGMKEIDRQLKLIESEKQRQRREHEVSCKEQSLQTLNFESRREYDLNDPKHLRKGVPARVGDADERCGPSSMQRFSGEDLMKEERVRQQRAAMVSTIEQQKFEKAMFARMTADSGAGASEVEEITKLRNEIEGNEVALRKELQRKQYEDNLAQANENIERKNAIMRANMDANDRELSFHAAENKLLNENAPSHFNNRVIRDAYKGSTRDERIKVAAEQRQQREEDRARKGSDKFDEQFYAQTGEMTRKQLVGMERDKARRRREMQEQIRDDNLKMQEEQRANTKHMSKMYKNAFSPEFFEQFGTGCR
jgi:hypothetical protein